MTRPHFYVQLILHPNWISTDPDAYFIKVVACEVNTSPQKTDIQEYDLNMLKNQFETLFLTICNIKHTDGTGNIRINYRCLNTIISKKQIIESQLETMWLNVTGIKNYPRLITVSIKLELSNYPDIFMVNDCSSGIRNYTLTPGGNVSIRGFKLKQTYSHPHEGIYIISAITGSISKVSYSGLVLNEPGELIFRVPRLSSGMYLLKVGSCFLRSNANKSRPDFCTYNTILWVLQPKGTKKRTE